MEETPGRPQRARKSTTNEDYDYRTKGRKTPTRTTPTNSADPSPVCNETSPPKARGRLVKKIKPEGSAKMLKTENSDADGAPTADAAGPSTLRTSSAGRRSNAGPPVSTEAIIQPPPKKLKPEISALPPASFFVDVPYVSNEEQRLKSSIDSILHKMAPLDTATNDRMSPSSSSPRPPNGPSTSGVSTAVRQQLALFPVKTMKSLSTAPHRLLQSYRPPSHPHQTVNVRAQRTRFPVIKSGNPHDGPSVREVLRGSPGSFRHIKSSTPTLLAHLQGAPGHISVFSGSAPKWHVPSPCGPSTKQYILKQRAQSLTRSTLRLDNQRMPQGAPRVQQQPSRSSQREMTLTPSNPRLPAHVQNAPSSAPLVQPQASASAVVEEINPIEIGAGVPQNPPSAPNDNDAPSAQPQEADSTSDARPSGPIMNEERPVKLEPIDTEYEGPNTSRESLNLSASESSSSVQIESRNSPMIVLPTNGQSSNNLPVAPLLRIIKPEPIDGDMMALPGTDALFEIRICPLRYVFNQPYVEIKYSMFIIENQSARPIAFRMRFSNNQIVDAEHTEGIIAPFEKLLNQVLIHPFVLDDTVQSENFIVAWTNVPPGQHDYTDAWFDGAGMVGKKIIPVEFI